MSIVLTMPETIESHDAVYPVDSATAEAAAEVAELLESGEETTTEPYRGDYRGWICCPKGDRRELEDIHDVVVLKHREIEGTSDNVDLYCHVTPAALESLDPHFGRFVWHLEPTDEKLPEQPLSDIDEILPAESTTLDAATDPCLDWQIRLQAAQDAHTEAAVECKKIAEQLKDARKAEKEALDTYISIRDAGPQQPAADNQGGESSVTSHDGNSSPSNSPLPTDENAWRSTPLTAIGLDDIRGLGKKKLEALLDACPTIGAFVDLQSKAGPMGVQAELPKGFGEAVSGELETAVVNWLTKNRDAHLFRGKQVVEQPAPVEQPTSNKGEVYDNSDPRHVDGLVGSEEPACELEETPAGYTPNIPESHFLDHLEYLSSLPIERIKELHDLKFDQFENGALGREKGETADQCPTMYSGDSRDAWLLGWLQVDLAKTGKALTEEQRAEPGTKKPAADAAPAAVSSVEIVDDLDLL